MQNVYFFVVKTPVDGVNMTNLQEEVTLVKEESLERAIPVAKGLIIKQHNQKPFSYSFAGYCSLDDLTKNLGIKTDVQFIEQKEERKTTPEMLAQYLKDQGWIVYKKKN